MTNSIATEGKIFSDSKNHFEILDGLRGVAAVMVVIFHLFDAFSGDNHLIKIINHGYLAVDFFFLLSGFVIGYAYNDRWNKMSLKIFFKRRLIRLHPMVIMGMFIGAICFYFGASPILFPQLSQVPFWKVLLTMFVGFTLLPLPTSMDIRGWGEMHPLNGPAWTLFFEYVGNILYAVFIRRISNTFLSLLVFLSACALIHLAVTSPNGDVFGGWSIEPAQFRIGITRLLFPFLAGVLLSRLKKPSRIKNAFALSVLMIIVVLSLPRVGGTENLWLNGLYESFSIVILFPLIVYIGASGEIKNEVSLKICKFFGNISYPIYIIHFPLIYIYSAWVVDNDISLHNGWPMGLLVLVVTVLMALACLKFYDIPVRKWLTTRFVNEN